MTSDGKPFAPLQFKQITQERYIISKHTNTSYLDVGEITPTERAHLIEFIKEDLERKKQIMQQQLEAQGLKF